MSEPADFLLLHGTVVTMDDQDRVLEDAGVAVRGGRIVAVDSSDALKQRFPHAPVTEARHKAILPGLVDTYGHAGHGMIKGFHHPAHGWPAGWLYWHATTPDWWYADGLLAALERLRFGVTTGFSIIGSTPARSDSPLYAHRHAEAYAQVGVRAVLGVGAPDPFFSHLSTDPWSGSHLEEGRWVERTFTYDDAIQNALQTVRDWHGGADGRVRIALASAYLLGRHMPHPRLNYQLPEGAAPVILEKALELRELANRHGLLIHTHMFKGSVRYGLEQFGREALDQILGPDVVIAHANALEPEEVEVLGATGCNIALVAYTAENVHYGFAPMVELLEAGANVTISTDGSAPYMSFDLWQDIKRTLWHAWLSHRSQRVLPPGKALRMVTIDAAKALGMGDEVGSLEVGKRADLITVNLNQPHLTPRTFLPQQLAYYATGQDVSEVWVEGKQLLKEGRVLGVDVEGALELAREEARKSFERAGQQLEPFLHPAEGFWREARY